MRCCPPGLALSAEREPYRSQRKNWCLDHPGLTNDSKRVLCLRRPQVSA
jgi:hypothetical protein